MKTTTVLPYLILLLLPVLTGVKALSQKNPYDSYIDISKVVLTERIDKTISTVYISQTGDLPQLFPRFDFKPGLQHDGLLPYQMVSKRIILRFNICNSADTTLSVYFCPGFYFNKIDLYKLTPEGIKEIPAALPPITDSIGFRQISLGAHDSVTIVAELKAIKTYNIVIRPRLIGKDHLSAFISQLHGTFGQSTLLTYIFCGLLLMMILFSTTNFFQGGNREFLYYSGYAFFLGILLFLQTYYHLHAGIFSYFLESYLDFIIQGTGIIFYMLFMKKFLDTKNKHPFLTRLYDTGIIILYLSMITYSFLHYFADNYIVEYMVENLTKILLLAMIIVFLVYSIRHREDKLLRYLFWGNLFLFLFSLMSQLGIMLLKQFRSLPGIFSNSIFYYEIGLFLELVFFLAGLNYKNRKNIITQTKERETLKAQNLLQEYEKKIAVYKAQQEERQRISADMHDELGAGMTAIRLMSEIARNKMKENTPRK